MQFNDQTAICMDKAFPPEKYTPEPLCWVLTADIHPAPNAINQDWAVCKAPAGGRSEVCNMATEADVVPSVDVGDDDERIYPPPAVCDVVVDATIELLYYLAKSEVDDGTIIYAVEALFFAAAIKTYAHAFEKAIDEDDEESEWCVVIDCPAASLPLPSISRTAHDFSPQPTDPSRAVSIPSAPPLSPSPPTRLPSPASLHLLPPLCGHLAHFRCPDTL